MFTVVEAVVGALAKVGAATGGSPTPGGGMGIWTMIDDSVVTATEAEGGVEKEGWPGYQHQQCQVVDSPPTTGTDETVSSSSRQYQSLVAYALTVVERGMEKKGASPGLRQAARACGLALCTTLLQTYQREDGVTSWTDDQRLARKRGRAQVRRVLERLTPTLKAEIRRLRVLKEKEFAKIAGAGDAMDVDIDHYESEDGDPDHDGVDPLMTKTEGTVEGGQRRGGETRKSTSSSSSSSLSSSSLGQSLEWLNTLLRGPRAAYGGWPAPTVWVEWQRNVLGMAWGVMTREKAHPVAIQTAALRVAATVLEHGRDVATIEDQEPEEPGTAEILDPRLGEDGDGGGDSFDLEIAVGRLVAALPLAVVHAGSADLRSAAVSCLTAAATALSARGVSIPATTTTTTTTTATTPSALERCVCRVDPAAWGRLTDAVKNAAHVERIPSLRSRAEMIYRSSFC